MRAGLVGVLRWCRRPAAAGLAVSLLLAGGGAFWFEHWLASRRTPSCSWPLRVQGHAPPVLTGLVRCYLRALAHDDTGSLQSMALTLADGSQLRITSAYLKHAADARSGLVTVSIQPNPSDTTNATAVLTYADGAREELDLQNEAAEGGAWVWRLDIGNYVGSGPPGPPPTKIQPLPTTSTH